MIERMRKMIALILSVLLALSAAAFAETGAEGFEELTGLEWCFTSGAGAWSTDMRIASDGSFTGEYHDSEMGEADEKAYPYGTVYVCSFSGQMRFGEQVNEYARKLHIDALTMDGTVDEERIEEGIRFVTTEPYGIRQGDEMLLYRPGTPVSEIPEEMLPWAHVFDGENTQSELETWFLCSEANDSGFVGLSLDEFAMENPWLEMTEEELTEASGLSFGVPEGAQDVVYSFLPGENLAQMLFTLDGDEYCARICPAALEAGQLMNIADMYFAWENEETITVGHCNGTIAQAQTGSEDWVELCLWYDLAPGLMYSLSVCTTEPDGLDLTAVAEQVYIPVQGDN